MTDESIGTLFEQLVDRVADRIADGLFQKLQGTGGDYVDQTASPLGPRRHIAAIRSGKLQGAKIGRQYIARAADVDAFVRNSPAECVADEPADEIDELAAELGLQKRSKGG